MRQYVFDQVELERLVRLTLRHGFFDGLLSQIADKKKAVYRQVEDASYHTSLGEILDGIEPSIYV